MTDTVEPGSFRDPAGFIFYRDGVVYRQINERSREAYDLLMGSGLYESLAHDGLLVKHAESPASSAAPNAYKIIQPEPLAFISYPYEWCFSQLRDAALTTLEIQKRAISFGMSLKDASAYNIQFQAGKPVLIDTLSFEKLQEGRPWVAYRQFCQHFLAPLALIQWSDVRLTSLLRSYLDGVPLDLASRLLPFRTRFDMGLLTHIHLHASAQSRTAPQSKPQPAQSPKTASSTMGRTALLGLIDNLQSTVKRLKWDLPKSTWSDYYADTNYSEQAMENKKRLVGEMLDSVQPRPATVWDLGANTGEFSKLAAERGAHTVAWDLDPAAVEKSYQEVCKANETRILPLVQDLTNPSQASGWNLRERKSLTDRGSVDVVLALALVHHLAIGGNVPLPYVAQFMASVGRYLIIEFVPKSDSQVQRMLATREDVFDHYTIDDFEKTFSHHFEILNRVDVVESQRSLYLMRTKIYPVNHKPIIDDLKSRDPVIHPVISRL